MSGQERERLVELEGVERGELSLSKAARRLRISYRQAKRLLRRFRQEGAQGLVHRGRGRSSNRTRPESQRQRALSIYREKLEGFGPTLAAEKLSEQGEKIDHETLRRWLLAEGLWTVRKHRPKHRRRRARKAHFGELVQLDGSHHDWFGVGRRCCLMSMVDDATSTRLSLLAEEETTEAAMRVLWRWIERHGVPLALYTDRKTVYVTDREPTMDEQLAGETALTAFGRACRKLGIEIIPASSPQAKGRVERSHGVYQDRLVKEIRLRRLVDIAAVNDLLCTEGFDDALNARFAQPAADGTDLHRLLPEGLELGGMLAFEALRTVQNDWTVRHQNRWYQITGPKRELPAPKSKVVVQQRLDGSLWLLHRGRPLEYATLAGPLSPTASPTPATSATPAPNPVAKDRPERPSATHPWRHKVFGRQAAVARRGKAGMPVLAPEPR
jgi:transposase